MTADPAAVKVMANLEVDEDGWPPFGSETLWCLAEPGGYRVNNIPYFVHGVSVGDLIAAEPDADGVLTYSRVLKASDNSTMWIIFLDGTDKKACLSSLNALGCDADGEPLKGYYAVNIPPAVSIAAVEDVIEPFVREGQGEAVFATVRHSG